MAVSINLFPQGHAVGEAFCNRKRERERLANCFLAGEHTVIVAPRRYGKSSLIKQVILDTKIPGKHIDLLPATNISFINKAIKMCFSELASQIAPKTKLAKEKVASFVQSLHPKLSLNVLGQRLEVSTPQSTEQSIIDLLVALDTLARKVQQKVVICFDEFQQISLLKNYHSIEASIRHAVEKSTHVTYVFSGSNRHLLSQMFNSKSRPLYHLCELMQIDKIKPEEYLPILLSRARKHWKKSMEEGTIGEILHLTRCHPYYVNALCRQLWKLSALPTTTDVQCRWLDYVKTQSNWISDDLARMTPNQRNIMAALAYRPTDAPTSAEFCQRVELGASSVSTSLSLLLNNDLVSRDNTGQFRVLDPAVEIYLLQIRAFDFSDE